MKSQIFLLGGLALALAGCAHYEKNQGRTTPETSATAGAATLQNGSVLARA